MSNYRKISILCILFLSIFSQSCMNIYYKYLDYVEHKQTEEYKKLIHEIKRNNASKNTGKITGVGHVEHSDYCTAERDTCDLPRRACFVLWFLKNSSIQSFRMSSAIEGDDVRYAVMEQAYPRRISEDSKYLVTTYDDILPKSCTVLDSNEGVKIAYCP